MNYQANPWTSIPTFGPTFINTSLPAFFAYLAHPCADMEGGYDHDWKRKSDWGGDPGVINGTFDIHEVECRTCGVVEADPDGGEDYEYFGDSQF